jgi:hypothetical protein
MDLALRAMEVYTEILLNGHFIFVLYRIFSGVLNWLDSSAKADHSSPDKVSIVAFMTYCFVLL